jgi:hypothetical protein
MNNTATMEVHGHKLVLDEGGLQSVARALGSTLGDPTALVRMGFARLSTGLVEPVYRYGLHMNLKTPLVRVERFSSGTWRDLYVGSFDKFIEEYGRGVAA